MAFSFRPASKAAASMRPFAGRLAKQLDGRVGVRHQVIDGYILRAVGDGRNVTVYVLEMSGFIGGAYGNLFRPATAYMPWLGYVPAMFKADLPPVSGLASRAGAPLEKTFDSFAVDGGIHVGSRLEWGQTHNILPSEQPRAVVMPSAIMLPAVAGATTLEELDDQKDAPGNRSVVIHRLNASTEWGSGSTTFYRMRLDAKNYEGAPAGIPYIEIAAGALNLGKDQLRSGSMSCIEWGPLEGLFLFNTEREPVEPETYLIEGEPYPFPTIFGLFPVGTVFPPFDSVKIGHSKVGNNKDHFTRLGGYRITVEDVTDAQGVTKKVYSATAWSTRLNGAGSSVVADTPPAMTAAMESFQEGNAPAATAWDELWVLRDALMWSPHAGQVGGHAVDGEEVLGIGSVILRRFVPWTKTRYRHGSSTPVDPGWGNDGGWEPPVMTAESDPALWTYHDRHTVRFKIKPSTGEISYESLYVFGNCYGTPKNDVIHHTGVGFNDARGTAWGAPAPFTDELEGFTHLPMFGFNVNTPATETEPELIEPFIACRRKRQLYEVIPEHQWFNGYEGDNGANGSCTEGPATIYLGLETGGPGIYVPEGWLYVKDHPRRRSPPYDSSPPARVPARNPTKAELIENDKVVVFGATGGEVVMDTGDYYPDFGSGGIECPPRSTGMRSNSNRKEFYPDRQALGVPACPYAPGIIAIVVIPKAQYPEPRAFWQWPDPYPGVIPSDDSPQEVKDAYYAAVEAMQSYQATPYPAPLPQDRYLALCDIRTGELLAVSEAPIYTGTAIQETPYIKHRSATVSLSCIEQGTLDAEGKLATHGVLMISIREAPHYDRFAYTYPTICKVTADFGATLGVVAEDYMGIGAYYLGTALKPAQINVGTGMMGMGGKKAEPPTA